MHVLPMRVDPVIAGRTHVVRAAPDLPVVDDVVHRWMMGYGWQEGDYIQSLCCQVDCMDKPAWVWVVVTHSGLVLAVADPPIGVPLPGWPTCVNLVPQAAQR